MSSDKSDQNAIVEKTWHDLLTYGESEKEKRYRKIFKIFPSQTKCKWCDLPFDHPASPLIYALFKKRPSQFNPRFCNICDEFARKYQGGAEIEISMVFADIRGSTRLAESMTVSQFKNLIDRFYRVTTDVFVQSDAMIDKLVGDEVTAFYMPGLAGENFASKAVQAAQDILVKTGHQNKKAPWAPVGIGIHTGVAFVGAVGTKDGMIDITALGDSVNVAARLASHAKAGEVILSEETVQAARLDHATLEKRSLHLKGKSDPLEVHVVKLAH